ncbi:MAG: hypothetical protein IJ519_03535, partial [Clostridia bacterium]|nr:hypothetical protein [Clostridia bacterium]
MKTNRRGIIALLLTAAMLVLAMPTTVAAASVEDAVASSAAAPVVALFETVSEDATTGEPVNRTMEYEVVTKDGEHYLFLPGAVDIEAVSLKYIGDDEMYVKDTKKYYLPGQSAVYDLSEGSVTVYEYASDDGRYVSYSLNVMHGSAIPSLYLTLDDVAGQSNTLAWLNSKKSNETTGSLLMVDAEGNVVYDNTCDTIKGRGNTSFVAPGIQYDNEHGYKDEKKSFNIKLTKKAELIEGAGKMKKWSLIHMRISEAYHYDWTGLCFNLGFQTYRVLSGEEYYGNMSQYVDVYIDGEYRGAYILV